MTVYDRAELAAWTRNQHRTNAIYRHEQDAMHGTRDGYRRHITRRETPCPQCAIARARHVAMWQHLRNERTPASDCP